MTTIQELLRKHIKENGYTVYSISASSGINRSMLNKVLTGQRKITKEMYDKLLPFFQLTPEEREELDDAFLIDYIGEKRHSSHMFIKKLIESVLISEETNNIVKNSAMIELPKSDIYMLSDKLQIQNAICSLVNYSIENYENPYLYSYINFQDDYMNTLCKQFNYTNKLEIKLLIEFFKINEKDDDRDNLYNLNTLTNLIPFMSDNCNEFSIYYYYVTPNVYQQKAVVFPYYIITNDCVILLSADYSHSCIIREKEMHQYYMRTYENLLSHSLVLTEGIIPYTALLSFLIDTDNKATSSMCLSVQPAIEVFIDEAMIDKYMYESPLKEYVKSSLMYRIDQLSERKGTTYFPREGLEIFVKEGKGINFPNSIASHLDVEDRIVVLERLLAANNKVHSFIMIKEDRFKAGASFALEPVAPNSVMLVLYNGENGAVTINLCENSLYNSLKDFFESIDEYGFAYSIEETNKIIKSYIEVLKQ